MSGPAGRSMVIVNDVNIQQESNKVCFVKGLLESVFEGFLPAPHTGAGHEAAYWSQEQ